MGVPLRALRLRSGRSGPRFPLQLRTRRPGFEPGLLAYGLSAAIVHAGIAAAFVARVDTDGHGGAHRTVSINVYP